MRLKIILLVMLIILSIISPVPALAAETDGKIEGRVVNATSSSNVADQEVTLKVFLRNSETDSKVARTDAKGQFVFDGLSTKSDYSYQITVVFQEAEYNSESVNFTDGTISKSLTITVYDATTSPQALRIDTAHTILYIEENGSLQVKTYALVGNSANLTYIGSNQIAPDKRETLKFTLPGGAKEVAYGLDLMECCVIPSKEGFSDTMAVLPGYKEVVYSYRIPYNSGKYTLTQKFDYPTTGYDLLVQGNTINVSSDWLTPVQPVVIEGQQFSRYTLEDIQGIAAGDVLKVELSGLPGSGSRRLIRVLAFGLLAIVFAFGLFYLLRGKRRQPAAVSESNSLIWQKQELLVEIAQLDDDFAAGKIAEDVYRTQRADKKARLLKLAQLLKEQKG